MTEYKVWAFARSATSNLPVLENQLAEVMREADRRGYIIINSSMEQKRGDEFWRPCSRVASTWSWSKALIGLATI